MTKKLYTVTLEYRALVAAESEEEAEEFADDADSDIVLDTLGPIRVAARLATRDDVSQPDGWVHNDTRTAGEILEEMGG